MEQHWFDKLNLTLAHGGPRRAALRAASVLFGGLIAGGALRTGAKQKHKKHKKHKKAKPDPPSQPPQLCSGGTCQEAFALPDNQADCEAKCNECDGAGNGDPRWFCIVADDPTDPSNPMKKALCCEEDEVCCGDECCTDDSTCCGGTKCCPPGKSCCGDGCCPQDDPDFACCDGVCVFTFDDIRHCGECGKPCKWNEYCRNGTCHCFREPCDAPCQPGATYCNGECVDTMTDPRHCGGCDNEPCGAGQVCHDGRCGCPPTCPQGKNCIHNDGSLCVELPNRTDCHCGCPPDYEYCQHREGHWVCVGDCSHVT
jgi:hypothetical protein